MHLQTFIDAMEQIAPLKYAESWDNVGLLVGDPQQTITGVMLCIDCTPHVVKEAMAQNCNVIVAYHPPIFSPLKRLTAGNTIFDAVRNNIAIYSPHTALDSAKGGTNDVLANILGLQDCVPLQWTQLSDKYFKLVTLVPEKEIEKISTALFDAGAGHIGNYSQCSFRTSGTGTFFGEEDTQPAVGKKGQLEHVSEFRLEVIISAKDLPVILNAFYKNHPYEEPVLDLIPITVTPNKIGQGRIGTLPKAISCEQIITRIKQGLGIDHVLVCGDINKNIQRIACLAGAGGEFLDAAIAQGAELYLTGEIRHHDALKAAKADMTVISTLHSHSERTVLKPLAEQLTKKCSGIKIQIAKNDRDPFRII